MSNPGQIGCDCVSEIEDRAREFTGLPVWLNTTMIDGPRRAIIEFYMIEKKPRGRKIPVVVASYCPFCGTEYPEQSKCPK